MEIDLFRSVMLRDSDGDTFFVSENFADPDSDRGDGVLIAGTLDGQGIFFNRRDAGQLGDLLHHYSIYGRLPDRPIGVIPA